MKKVVIKGRKPQSGPTKYKNRETLVFKGLTYRYDSYYGEWRLVNGARVNRLVPRTIFEQGLVGVDHTYSCDGHVATTPLGALEKWIEKGIMRRQEEILSSGERLAGLKKEIQRLKSKDWTNWGVLE